MQKTVKGKLAFDCPVVRLYFGFTPTFDIEPKSKDRKAFLPFGLNFIMQSVFKTVKRSRNFTASVYEFSRGFSIYLHNGT